MVFRRVCDPFGLDSVFGSCAATTPISEPITAAASAIAAATVTGAVTAAASAIAAATVAI